VFSGTRFVLTNGITEVSDAKQMARFFQDIDDWPLSNEDAVTLGVDTDRKELTNGWCLDFLDAYENTQSLRAEDLLKQTVQRKGTFRGTPRESISALLITLATANEIALRRDNEYITEPEEIGRAVRNKTKLAEVQIRFDTPDGPGNLDQVRETVRTLTGGPPDGNDPDAWLSELADWVDNNRVLVKRVFRGVSREFGKDASLDDLETGLEPALNGEQPQIKDLATDDVERQAGQFARAKDLFHPDEDGETLWERFSNQTAEMQRLHPSADVTADMQNTVSDDEVPDAGELREMMNTADAHRQRIIEEQSKRITDEVPVDENPEEVVSSLATWLYAHDGSSKEVADRISVEFDGVTIDELYNLFETAWEGDSFSEEELVAPMVVQQTKRYKQARQLLKSPDSSTSLWTQLQETSKRLEQEHPNHPITSEVNEVLGRSHPPTVDRVEQLLRQAENPFKLSERLEELAGELQSKYPDDDLTQNVVEVTERSGWPSEERMTELIEKSEQLLDDVDEQLRRIRELMDELPDGSVVMIEPVD
jgi:hypothetical protein